MPGGGLEPPTRGFSIPLEVSVVFRYYTNLFFMAEPTIIIVYGSSATQDETTLTISKVDLASVGLTAASDNTAESLLSAIVLLAKDSLTEAAFESNQDQSITVTNGFDGVVQRDDGSGNFVTYFQRPLSVNLHKLADTDIDPDDY